MKNLIEAKDLKKISKSEITDEEVVSLYAFWLSAKKAGLPEEYHFGDAQSDSIYINKKNGRWEVYKVDKGQRCNGSLFTKCEDACVELMKKLCQHTIMLGDAISIFDRFFKDKKSMEHYEEFMKLFDA